MSDKLQRGLLLKKSKEKFCSLTINNKKITSSSWSVRKKKRIWQEMDTGTFTINIKESEVERLIFRECVSRVRVGGWEKQKSRTL